MSSKIGFLQEFECPICTNYMTGRVYLCAGGHSFCADCVAILKQCPICRKPMGSIRNYSLESLAGKIESPCQNANEGCETKSSLAELNEHQQKCHYRLYECQMQQCSWKGRKLLLLEHVLGQHRNYAVEDTWTTSWKRNETSDIVVLIQMKEEVFYIHQKVRNETVYWAVQYLGISEEAKNYRYSIRIGLQGQRDLSMTDICCSDLLEINEIIERNTCTQLPLSLLQRYFDEDSGNIYLAVTVIDGRSDNANVTSKECIASLNCQLKNCSWEGSRFDRLVHLQTEHNSDIIDIINYGTYCYMKPDPNESVILMKYNESFFYVFHVIKDEMVHWIVQYIGEPAVAKCYYYAVFLDGIKTTSYMCTSDLQVINELITNRDCPYFPLIHRYTKIYIAVGRNEYVNNTI